MFEELSVSCSVRKLLLSLHASLLLPHFRAASELLITQSAQQHLRPSLLHTASATVLAVVVPQMISFRLFSCVLRLTFFYLHVFPMVQLANIYYIVFDSQVHMFIFYSPVDIKLSHKKGSIQIIPSYPLLNTLSQHQDTTGP